MIPFYSYLPFKLQALDVIRRMLLTKYAVIVLLLVILPQDYRRAVLYLTPLLLALDISSRKGHIFNDSYFVKFTNIVIAIHCVFFLWYVGESLNVRELRKFLGAGSPIVLVGLHVVLKRKNRIVSTILYWGYIILTGSRTLMIGGILVHFFSWSKRLRYIVLTLIVITISLYDIDITSLEFIYLPEARFSIHENFRGFEVFSVFNAIINAPFFNFLFGFGLGSEIPLYESMVINDVKYSSVPIIHNSYVWFLYKFGIIGLTYITYTVYKRVNSLDSKYGLFSAFLVAGFLVWGWMSFEWVILMIYLFRRDE